MLGSGKGGADNSNGLHVLFDVAGQAPIAGEVLDLVNAGVYAQEGDRANASISLAGAVPLVGSAATLGRLGLRAGRGADELVSAAKPGRPTLDEPASGVPHDQIRATTARQIRAAGGTVKHAPELTRSGVLNPLHVNICLGRGPCPFGPLQPNPVPKAGRIR